MTDIRIVDHPQEQTAVVREQIPMAQLTEFFPRAFNAAMTVAQAQGLALAGPPFGKYYGIPGETVDVEAGFPVAGTVSDGEGVVAGTLPAARVVQAVHVGPYDTLPDTYREVERWVDERQLRTQEVMWESYLTDPGQQPDPSQWQTMIVVPLVEGQEAP
ncbi:MAG: GyrI-like domain-containing protein [Dermatophilaceae bacterium]